MAARPGEAIQHTVALRQLPPDALSELLDEEVRRWRSRLHWDFTPSADLVRRYIAMQALDGLALVEGDAIAGYCYWVSEERKALIGDFYVRDAWRNAAAEQFLLEQALAVLGGGGFARTPVARVEGQLMNMELRAAQFGRASLAPLTWPRDFMLASLGGVSSLRPISLPPEIRIERWGPRWLDASAELMEESYRGHIDSEINDQYHTAAGARRFLQNIIQYPGCGQFTHQSSWVALDRAGAVRGIAIATHVAPGTGHVAQVCVAPELRSIGLGYELMRRTLCALAAEGAFEASLTVTSANAPAVRLYQRLGFHTIHLFEALVWDRRPRGPRPALL
jgi:ribosomal protein S18 acetylase RimI-like enzyme